MRINLSIYLSIISVICSFLTVWLTQSRKLPPPPAPSFEILFTSNPSSSSVPNTSRRPLRTRWNNAVKLSIFVFFQTLLATKQLMCVHGCECEPPQPHRSRIGAEVAISCACAKGAVNARGGLSFQNRGPLQRANGIPVNVIMEQSPVAWPLPFLDSSRDDHERRVAAALALETVHDSDWFDSSDSDWTWFHHDQRALRTWFHSDHADLMTLDSADVGDVLVAVFFFFFFFFSSWIFEALGGIFRSWRRNFLWRSTAVGLLCDYDSRLLDRVRWWPPHMVSPEIVSNMKRWTVWWR